jgi:ribonuclease BN (tRNA processing enzyme)
MKITFLGSGGGRFVVSKQMRASGGWILEMSGQIFHVDPGPGTLVRAKQYGISLKKMTGVIISHSHPDHCADAELIVELMTDWIRKRRGVIIGNSDSIIGEENHRPAFSPYHLKAVDGYDILKPDKSINVGKVKVTGTRTKHQKTGESIGFVFDGEKRIGYTSDSEYFKGMEKYFHDCDILIVNCLRPRKETWPNHMNSDQVVELISKARPKLTILNHFGIKMLRVGPEKEAAWIEKQTGIKTIAAEDGMVLESYNGKIKTMILEKREV